MEKIKKTLGSWGNDLFTWIGMLTACGMKELREDED